LLFGKINPAKKQGLSFTIPTGFLYNPLCWKASAENCASFPPGGIDHPKFAQAFRQGGNEQPKIAQAFPQGEMANRNLRKLFPRGKSPTEICASVPPGGNRQPEAFFMSLDAKSRTNQCVEPFYLKYHRKPSNPNLWLL
jgi:hypothetical protein